MAFTQSTFVPVSAQANSNAPRIFMYKTDDLIATVQAADYFLDAYQVLNADDKIMVYADDDGNGSFFELIVTAATETTVTTLQALQQTLTAAGAVTPGVKSVELVTTGAAAVTIADLSAHQGLFAIKDRRASGTSNVTVTATSGTYNGTNNVATLNAANEALFVWVDSQGNGSIVENVGSVALS